MPEIEIGDIAWQIASRCDSEEEVRSVLARLADVDYSALMSKIEDERNQWECVLCHEFKDRRTFTRVWNKQGQKRYMPLICPECFIEKAIFQAVCIGCLKGVPALIDMEYTCTACEDINVYVSNNNTRARKVHLPATLTLRQYMQTMSFFDGKCAYCSRPSQCLEHYLPLSLGGGSTVDNCLPSCYKCNILKSDRHPDDFDDLFPAPNLARIRAYLEKATQKIANKVCKG